MNLVLKIGRIDDEFCGVRNRRAAREEHQGQVGRVLEMRQVGDAPLGSDENFALYTVQLPAAAVGVAGEIVDVLEHEVAALVVDGLPAQSLEPMLADEAARIIRERSALVGLPWENKAARWIDAPGVMDRRVQAAALALPEFPAAAYPCFSVAGRPQFYVATRGDERYLVNTEGYDYARTIMRLPDAI